MSSPLLRELEVDCIALAPMGGVVQIAEQSVLVPGLLPNERGRVVLNADKRSATLQSLLQASPHRTTPECSHFGVCGGCTWQHASESLQRESRQQLLRRALPPALRAHPINDHRATEHYGYRVRARLAWERAGGEIRLGFHARTSRQIADTPDCRVLSLPLQAALEPVRNTVGGIASAGEIDLAQGIGSKPVATLRPTSGWDGTKAFSAAESLLRHGFSGVALMAPGASSPALFGDPTPWIEGIDGRPLRIARSGFSQANESVNAQLVRWVLDEVGTDDTLLELFAGAGNFTVGLAPRMRKITAVESDREACQALKQNLESRGLENVSVMQQDALEAVRQLRRSHATVVLDPPRTGAKEIVDVLEGWDAKSIAYISCDPATLGRDLAVLIAKRWEVASIATFEMFPQTPHLETAVVLRRAGRRR